MAQTLASTGTANNRLDTPCTWEGFDGLQGTIDGRPTKLFRPKKALPGNPWAWRTEFFGAFAATDVMLLERGFHLAYMDVQDHYGCPKAMAHFGAFYAFLRSQFELAPRAALIGLSRGGLFAFNWAARNPDKVACIYADNPVCDFKSWPGGKGTGPGSPDDWKKLLAIYGFASEADALAWPTNPIDNLKPIAHAKIPVILVVGDADEVVPLCENADILRTRYAALGGPVREIRKPGALHHPHGLNDPTPVADFIVAACTAS